MNTKKYSPKLPIDIDNNGNFIKIDSALENAKQNLKMIILTNPGEKIMNPDFGVGIRSYLFENNRGIIRYNMNGDIISSVEVESMRQKIANSIESQCIKYANDISIQNIDVNIDEQVLNLRIDYTYRESVSDVLELVISA